MVFEVTGQGESNQREEKKVQNKSLGTLIFRGQAEEKKPEKTAELVKETMRWEEILENVKLPRPREK